MKLIAYLLINLNSLKEAQVLLLDNFSKKIYKVNQSKLHISVICTKIFFSGTSNLTFSIVT